MTYKLFLDDERFPPDYDEGWVLARRFEDAVWYVESRGAPEWIAFDHDLGEGRNGYQFAKWFWNYVHMNGVELPANFNYSVHSMNPVGAKNIREYMESLMGYYNKRFNV